MSGKSFRDVILGPEDGPYACPCCSYVTLRERGGFSICPVCFWEDDGQDDHDADEVRGGPNASLSLTQARVNYRRLGASDERSVAHVRPPNVNEYPATDDFRWPGRTELRLWFFVWGKDVAPETLTEATGIEPSRTFHIGESRGAYAKNLAGWEWRRDGWTEPTTAPLFDEALAVLGPHENVFAQSSAAGAEICLSVGGYVYGEVISSLEEADRRRFEVGDPEKFRPFFSGDRVELFIGPELLGFLSRVGATLTTHIDAGLDDEAH